ncbi:MAG: KEOPS complex kinase/ATPase Bud32 [archaeon]
MPETIARGAEAILVRDGARLSKERISKGYRAPELDSRLRHRRTRLEARVIDALLRAGANVPRVISTDENSCKIEMDFLDGKKARDRFSEKLVPKIAEQIIIVHSAGIIHGDITTSNMILSSGKIWLIDFGLAKFSSSVEDRAVDIHLFSQALESTHTPVARKAFGKFLKIYGRKFPEVVARLKKVESRGRYR